VLRTGQYIISYSVLAIAGLASTGYSSKILFILVASFWTHILQWENVSFIKGSNAESQGLPFFIFTSIAFMGWSSVSLSKMSRGDLLLWQNTNTRSRLPTAQLFSDVEFWGTLFLLLLVAFILSDFHNPSTLRNKVSILYRLTTSLCNPLCVINYYTKKLLNMCTLLILAPNLYKFLVKSWVYADVLWFMYRSLQLLVQRQLQ